MAFKPSIALCAAFSVAVTGLLAGSFAAPAQADSTSIASTSIAAARFIVTPETKATTNSTSIAAAKTADKVDAKIKTRRELGTGSELVVLDRKLSPADTAKYIQELKADPAVKTVAVDERVYISDFPNDPDFSKQKVHYGSEQGGARVDAAWKLSKGKGVKVAVIDSGIINHSDLKDNVLPGYDFISDTATSRDGDGRDANPNDEGDWFAPKDKDCGEPAEGADSSWHGTHVAGTIAAVTNNGKGVAGVAPDAKIIPVRALGKCGGYTSDIIDAIVWASGGTVKDVPANPNKADIINMSIGGRGVCHELYQGAIDAAVNAGVTVIVAAGNNSKDAKDYVPASCKNVVTIASHGQKEKISSFSNFGDNIDLSGPGGEFRGEKTQIWSTVDKGLKQQEGESYGPMMGTSMATPHVSGVAALMKSVNPGLKPLDVEQILRSTTRKMECDLGCGTGALDAVAAVKAAQGHGAAPEPTVAPSASAEPTTAPTSTQPTTAPTSATPTSVPTSAKPTAVPSSSAPTTAPTSAKPTSAPTSTKPTTSSTPTVKPSASETAKPTSTPSASKTPTTAPVSSAIVNGSFEEGAKGWTGDITKALGGEFGANSGSRRAALGGLGHFESMTISQHVNVPAGAKKLSFFLGVRTNEKSRFTVYDRFVVRIDGKIVGTYSNLDASDNYLERSIDLSAYAGRQVNISFGSYEDLSSPTTFLFDDVRVS